MEIFFKIVSLLGGLAMFLYGMRIMGDGLKSTSGGAMKAALARVTDKPFKGFLLGLIVTCMIQSSTAAIVLTVGLVGAGFLTFRQSIGIVLGANVGTTITAQIIRLMDVKAGSTSFLSFFKSDNLAPMALVIGIVLIMFVSSRAAHTVGTILMGFGTLFVGLMNMSAAVSHMGDTLSKLLVSFEGNPALGFFSGVLVTGIIQSSSAVVGILQSIASTIGIKFCGVFAVIIGIDIGDCLTTYLVCRIGAKPEQIRTALVHILYNFTASILLFIAVGVLRGTGIIDDHIWYMTLRAGGVANVHGLFKLIPALLLLPCAGIFAKVAERLVPDQPEDPEDTMIKESIKQLDLRLINNPRIALGETHSMTSNMFEVALHNYTACIQQMYEYDPKRNERMNQREDMIDKMTDVADKYVVEISPHITLDYDDRFQSFLMKGLVSIERIGDLAINIMDAIKNMR
ncbi:MAG: Na/Pi cotransporter family protein [Mogibacterium diversum]|nr:Na/Pi cotransporter family protein [Mogibacterium diversum]